MNRMIGRLVLIVILVGFFASGSSADVPLLINYRGYVDVSDPVIGLPTGALTVDLEFNLYDSSEIESATPLWTEDQTVQILDGNFAVMLGSVTPFSLDLFADGIRYLAVDLEGETIVGPQQILSVPYAMQAGNVYSAPNGYVGIGTTSPTSSFDVMGNVEVSGTLETGDDINASGDFSANSIITHSVTTDSITADGYIESTSGGIKFPDGTTMSTIPDLSLHSLDAADGTPEQALYVDNNGQVGIGTQTPSKDLQVAGEAIVDETLTISAWKIQPLPANWKGIYLPYGGIGIGNSALGSMLVMSQGSEVDYSNKFLFGVSQDAGESWDFPLIIRKSGQVLIQQESWTAPTLENSWINYGGLHNPAGYFKDSLGMVHLRGLVYRNAPRNESTLFTLPAGYRPEYQEICVISVGNSVGYGFGRMDVTTDGNVLFRYPNDGYAVTPNNWICLDGISFRGYQ